MFGRFHPPPAWTGAAGAGDAGAAMAAMAAALDHAEAATRGRRSRCCGLRAARALPRTATASPAKAQPTAAALAFGSAPALLPAPARPLLAAPRKDDDGR